MSEDSQRDDDPTLDLLAKAMRLPRQLKLEGEAAALLRLQTAIMAARCSLGGQGCRGTLDRGWAVMHKPAGNSVVAMTVCPVCAKALETEQGFEMAYQEQ